jgi:hypothetical protein
MVTSAVQEAGRTDEGETLQGVLGGDHPELQRHPNLVNLIGEEVNSQPSTAQVGEQVFDPIGRRGIFGIADLKVPLIF